ncbi:hypothetical protein EJF18_20804 [Clavispora lusitaniae]|uniref:Uncharacterized protein n=1 Tax=Clavispora lusitaniae TaxID=36911 RepID=A0ACD0WH53_CLALS|nr:hypothetical protein E0198_001328 [Clavispora lusitaniae]QFZ26884.1 hypothetical protein EJF14_20804 [Clavispora lusitaniae]QFZ32552.1 hypothetical protein EJF16_20804 [Clavispora lusitaniae]QFZ38221.1 hypothetical protein EJF15_20804 [Clavispora lusitaniae]QFZ43904.1 hypothetical protein EJF18_20804 [Clavispora lusitaniae]
MVQEQPTLTAKRRPPSLELSNQATADLLVRIVSPIVPSQVPDELRDTLRLSNSIREQQNTLIAQKSASPRAPDTQNAASDAVPAPDVVPAPDSAKSTNSNEESEQPTKQTAVGSDTRASSHGPEPDSVAISAVEPGPHDVSGPNSVSESTRSPHLAPHSHSASRSVSPDKGRASPQRIPKVPSPLRGPAVSHSNFNTPIPPATFATKPAVSGAPFAAKTSSTCPTFAATIPLSSDAAMANSHSNGNSDSNASLDSSSDSNDTSVAHTSNSNGEFARTSSLARKRLRRDKAPRPLRLVPGAPSPIVKSAPMRSFYGFRRVVPMIPPYSAVHLVPPLTGPVRRVAKTAAPRRSTVQDVFRGAVTMAAPIQAQPLSAQREHFDDRTEPSPEEMAEMDRKRTDSRESDVAVRGTIAFNDDGAFNFKIYNDADAKRVFMEVCEKTWDKYVDGL